MDLFGVLPLPTNSIIGVMLVASIYIYIHVYIYIYIWVHIYIYTYVFIYSANIIHLSVSGGSISFSVVGLRFSGFVDSRSPGAWRFRGLRGFRAVGVRLTQALRSSR